MTHADRIRPTVNMQNMRIAMEWAADLRRDKGINMPADELVAHIYDSLCQDEANLRRLNEESYKESGR